MRHPPEDAHVVDARHLSPNTMLCTVLVDRLQLEAQRACDAPGIIDVICRGRPTQPHKIGKDRQDVALPNAPERLPALIHKLFSNSIIILGTLTYIKYE